MSEVGVLGAGSWGTTLADLLARRGHRVRLWAHEPEVVAAVNATHENPLFLPGCPLAPALEAREDPVATVQGAELVVVVAPSHVLRGVVERARGGVSPDAVVVSATKGIEADSLYLMSDVIQAALPSHRVAAISGPSFALEVYQGQPTAVVAAAATLDTAQRVQSAFATQRFRVYTSLDVIGVQLGGALKNIIAIAAGILDGLGLGHNPRAALITRGLAEIARLGQALGADPLTFSGLAGMGDLILTSTGALSRNRALGIALAKGDRYEDYIATHRTVAEGASTARAALALAARHGVELPICDQVACILFEGRPPRQAVAELMDRTLKAEQWR
ncbi:MAG: NAD(P)-dependent glycerol-3-phosphate dehydrogenase [Gemmatimonadota bacterium]|nr:NAD(P)-dependent glycerol-3-phosphate dehydrogenase [Gemmatimonadota bacterium]MDH4348656.1 NAD(P)-dependent glycerol-3-phosphate dehydrogenase [Gemmatimonadota bacterium]